MKIQKQPEIKEINKNKTIVIGFATFKQQIASLMTRKELLKSIKDTLPSERWKIDQTNQYIVKEWRWIFAKMLSSENTTLLIQNAFLQQNYFGKSYQIIKDISHIHFQKLAYLSLKNNKIKNIQELTLMRFQNLKLLDLANNYITNVQSLCKCFQAQIEIVCFYDNKMGALKNTEIFKRILKQNNKKKGILTWDYPKNNKIQHQDLSILIYANFQYLHVPSQNRINQSKIRRMIRKKCPQSIIIANIKANN